MTLYQRALELREETVAHRRFFHQNAEVGLHMPKARAYVMEKLQEYGLNPTLCGEGVTATIGQGGSCILLRADMDALPMPEESGEPFACSTGTENHACGHDFHAAMLLTAARILKEREDELAGTVKLMFQTGEETLEGCRNMLENGVLSSPVPDAALAFHVTAGKLPVGTYLYNSTSTMMYSANALRITIRGRGAHGAYPQDSVDPINVGVHMHLAFQSLIAREADPGKGNMLTFGKFCAGTAGNVIPDTAVLEGSLRCDDREQRDDLLHRVREVSDGVAETFGAEAELELLSDIPPLVCQPELTNEMAEYLRELDIPGSKCIPGIRASASEDFALVAERVPSCYVYLSAGFPNEKEHYPVHSPKVRFSEDVCPIGAAAYAHCAIQFLKNHK